MSRAYGGLVIGVVAAALLISVVARLPRARAPEQASAAAVPEIVVDLIVSADAISPATLQVPKEQRVRLSLVSRAARPVRVALAGYEDRVRVTLAPGQSWRGSFVANLPGEGFAWLLDDEPVGRLVVTGSHLVEGHR